MRPALVLGAAAALLLAPASAAPASGSGLFGVVRRGPIAPVCFENRPCDEPAANVTIIFTRNGREAARVKTRRDGSYRVALAAGAYRVRTPVKAAIGRGLEPAKVRVPSGRRARIDFMIDTGIR